jgi:gamma-glutamylcyclotransferase (GGCT)/AIG2-like uncharacterized protein YtfP
MKELQHFVFVYGTLKQGHRNQHVINQYSATYMGEALTTSAVFNMIVQASASSPGKMTPGVYLDHDQGHHIEGELYHVTDEGLEKLDELEQVGINYNREEILVHCDGKDYTAWVYLKIEMNNSLPTSQYIEQCSKKRSLSWVHKG